MRISVEFTCCNCGRTATLSAYEAGLSRYYSNPWEVERVPGGWQRVKYRPDLFLCSNRCDREWEPNE